MVSEHIYTERRALAEEFCDVKSTGVVNNKQLGVYYFMVYVTCLTSISHTPFEVTTPHSPETTSQLARVTSKTISSDSFNSSHGF